MASGEASPTAPEPDCALCDWLGTLGPAAYLIGWFPPCLSGFDSASPNQLAAPLETVTTSAAGHVLLAQPLLGLAACLASFPDPLHRE
jgi:hypothetical protein